MKLKLITTTVIVLVLGLSTAEAQPGLRVQRHRIEQGVRSRELTRTEARNLSLQQRNMHRNVRRAKADGLITPRERKGIRMDQRQHSRSIYRMKHNQRNRI